MCLRERILCLHALGDNVRGNTPADQGESVNMKLERTWVTCSSFCYLAIWRAGRSKYYDT